MKPKYIPLLSPPYSRIYPTTFMHSLSTHPKKPTHLLFLSRTY